MFCNFQKSKVKNTLFGHTDHILADTLFSEIDILQQCAMGFRLSTFAQNGILAAGDGTGCRLMRFALYGSTDDFNSPTVGKTIKCTSHSFASGNYRHN